MNNKLKIIIIFLATTGMVYKYTETTFNAEDFGLGEGTTSHYAYKHNYPIHINKLNDKEFGPFIEGIQANASNKEITLFLGNSQTHGINQYKDVDSNYVHLMHSRFDSEYVVSQSIQNASLQFFLLSLSYLHAKTDLNKVVIPLFYDDFKKFEQDKFVQGQGRKYTTPTLLQFIKIFRNHRRLFRSTKHSSTMN